MVSFRGGMIARTAYASGPVIEITNATVLESASIDTTVTVLSVAGGTGTYVFTLTDSAGGKFTTAGTNGVNLNTAAALDYETATSHNITVSATNGGAPITRTIVITVTNVVEDTTPNAFTFTDVTGATVSTVYESNSITVAGMDGPATMTITGGEYSINGGTYASASTSVVAGDTVKVRGTSSGSGLTAVNVVLTIGGVSDTFTITTAAVSDSTPDAFSFTDVTGAALSTIVESNTITVAGINVAATLTVSGGEYSINGGGYASASTTVVVGNTVKVRGTSSALNSTAVNVTLTIGGVSDTFTITTLASGAPSGTATYFIYFF
jgi:hypothetical protein